MIGSHRRFASTGRYTLLALLPLLAACGERDPDAPGHYGFGHALPRLISETPALAPGETHTLGVTFDIEPGWHVYWNGANDTGYPITVTWKLPAGYTVGELQWPAPERLVSEGGILDHVYAGQVTLLATIQVPADAKPGSDAVIACRAEWLACKSVCVPGQGDAFITLTVARGGTDLWRALADRVPPDTARRFAASRSRLPVAPPDDDSVVWRWEDRTLEVQSDTDHMAFYPGPESAPLEHLIETGVSESGTLSLRLSKDPGSAEAVSGVLVVSKKSTGEARYYDLQIPLPGSG